MEVLAVGERNIDHRLIRVRGTLNDNRRKLRDINVLCYSFSKLIVDIDILYLISHIAKKGKTILDFKTWYFLQLDIYTSIASCWMLDVNESNNILKKSKLTHDFAYIKCKRNLQWHFSDKSCFMHVICNLWKCDWFYQNEFFELINLLIP